MTRRTGILFCAALLLLAAPGFAGTQFVTDSVIEAEVNLQPHPTEFTTGVLVPVDLKKADICLQYKSTIKKGNQGKIRTDAVIVHEDGEQTKMKFNGRVKNNEMVICKKVKDLKATDVVLFEIRFLDFPNLRIGEKRGNEAVAVKGVVTSGIKFPEPEPEPEPEPQSCPGPNPDPDPDPDPDPNPNPDPDPDPDPDPQPSATLSAADQRAADSLLNATNKTQLWRAKTGWGVGKWMAIGPKTQLDSSAPGGVRRSTTGYGSTIAGAVANYEKKMGKLAKGSGLNSSDLKSLEWYSKINASGGPTSIRKSGSGGYFGEYYRPGKGARHNGPYGSITKAVNWLKGQGIG